MPRLQLAQNGQHPEDLPPGQQEFFRRLGLHLGTTIDAYAAALAGTGGARPAP
jgi:hypothetical protein